MEDAFARELNMSEVNITLRHPAQTDRLSVHGFRPMTSLFPVDPEAKRGRPRRRLVPFTAVLPNLVTLLGLCAGLTAIRMAVEHRFDLAIAGHHPRHHPRRHRRPAGALFPRHVAVRRGARFARRLRQFRRRAGALRLRLASSTSSPPSAGSVRWSSRSAPGCGSRASTRRSLAEEPQPDWSRDFFVGAPAPAGAGLVLLPFFLRADRLTPMICSRRSSSRSTRSSSRS